MKTDGIIFDVDGTLWDATPRICEAYNEIIKQDGRIQKEITLSQMQSVMGLTIPDIADTFFFELEKEERLDLIDKCCTYECEYLKMHGGTLYPNVILVLKELSKEFPLYIVSNCQDGYIESLFSLYDIEQYFLDYECSGRTNLAKHDNISFIVERNGLQRPIYIGDTIKDKEACEKAKVPFIYASFGFGDVTEYDVKIDDYNELLTMFEVFSEE